VSGAVQTLVAGLVGIGMATAVLLPGRQTVGVIKAIRDLLSGSLSTAITGKK
jgi:hypothetical protein